MPRIVLKPNSPEYANPDQNAEFRCCDMPGCTQRGEFKAPKHRGLNEYHYFCLDHIREYNQAWNFFSGMNADEVQDHMNDSLYGFRPTWRYDNYRDLEDQLRSKAWQARGDQSDDFKYQDSASSQHQGPPSSAQGPEIEALAIMGLEPPIELDDIKAVYKKLAKKYHPDLNNNDKEAEEKLKKINMAYTILKMAYAEFEKLPERS